MRPSPATSYGYGCMPGASTSRITTEGVPSSAETGEPDRNGHQAAVRGLIKQLPPAWAPPPDMRPPRSIRSGAWPCQGSSARTRLPVQLRST